MKGVASPTLLVKPEYTPHEYSLRPSDARALASSDAVFWIGEDLTPWLDKSLDSLATTAVKVSLLNVSGTTLHEFREGATFEDHTDHDEHVDEVDEHDHHNEHDHEDHGHQEYDPHAWLDPVNAQVWVREIAQTLSTIDPSNAELYTLNAAAAASNLQRLIEDNKHALNETGIDAFVVFHDAYQYFENRFGIVASGAISISDSTAPSPARVAEIRHMVEDIGVSCVFTEPQFNANLVHSVFDGTGVVTIGIMDPIGANIPIGENQYVELINALATSVQECSLAKP